MQKLKIKLQIVKVLNFWFVFKVSSLISNFVAIYLKYFYFIFDIRSNINYI